MGTTSSAQVQVDTSTRHDLRIVLPDSALQSIDPNDEVYIHIAGRGKEITRKMSYRDLEHLLATGDSYDNEGRWHPPTKHRPGLRKLDL